MTVPPALPRIEWRPLRSGERDHERLWLTVGSGCAGIAALFCVADAPHIPCLFHTVTGCPCPGCGTTRAVLALSRGDFIAALAWNPLATLASAIAAAFMIYAAAVLLFRAPRLRLRALPQSWATVLRISIIAAIAANWAWVIARGN